MGPALRRETLPFTIHPPLVVVAAGYVAPYGGAAFFHRFVLVAPSSVTAEGRDTSCPRCGIRFPGPLGHGNRAAAWLCPRFIRRRRRFGHSPPWGKAGRLVVSVCHSTGGGTHCYRVAGRRAPVTAREARAAGGASAPGVGGGPYEGLRIAPSSVTAFSGRATSCPRCGIRFPGPLGHGNRAAAWLCPRFIRRWRRFGHSPPEREGGACCCFG